MSALRFVPAGLQSHLMIMMVVIVVMMVRRSADHALDAADNAARHSTNHAANRRANRTGGAPTLSRASLATFDNALSLCGERRQKNDGKAKKTSGSAQPGFHR